MRSHHKSTQTPGLEQIRNLGLQGVNVAEGNGTLAQKTIVFAAIGVSVFLFVVNGIADLLFLAMLPLVIVIIDFLSGFVHWFFDTQVEPSETFLGRIAVDFLDHHVRPGRTAEVGFFVSAYRPAVMVTLPLVIIASALPLSTAFAGAIFWIGFLSMLVPQTHKHAHLGQRPAPISWMQKSRLILNPESHHAHHADNSQSFCVFTGWLNPVLDRVRFWRGLERLVNNVKGRDGP